MCRLRSVSKPECNQNPTRPQHNIQICTPYGKFTGKHQHHFIKETTTLYVASVQTPNSSSLRVECTHTLTTGGSKSTPAITAEN